MRNSDFLSIPLTLSLLGGCASHFDFPESAGLCVVGTRGRPAGSDWHDLKKNGQTIATFELRAEDVTQAKSEGLRLDRNIYWIRLDGHGIDRDPAKKFPNNSLPVLYDLIGTYIDIDGKKIPASGRVELGRDLPFGKKVSLPVDLSEANLKQLAQAAGIDLSGSGSPIATYIAFDMPPPTSRSDWSLQQGWRFYPGSVTVLGQRIELPPVDSCYSPAGHGVINHWGR